MSEAATAPSSSLATSPAPSVTDDDRDQTYTLQQDDVEEEIDETVSPGLFSRPAPLHAFQEAQKRFARLGTMLQRSMLYSKLLTERIQQQNEEAAPAKRGRPSKKRAREDGEDVTDGTAQKRVKAEDGTSIARQGVDFAQPKLVTGGTLRDYQLAGVQWMTGLYLNRYAAPVAPRLTTSLIYNVAVV